MTGHAVETVVAVELSAETRASGASHAAGRVTVDVDMGQTKPPAPKGQLTSIIEISLDAVQKCLGHLLGARTTCQLRHSRRISPTWQHSQPSLHLSSSSRHSTSIKHSEHQQPIGHWAVHPTESLP